MRVSQRRSHDFFLGGPPGTFSVISPGADRIQWGGGVVADIFPVNKSITFPRFRDIVGTFSGHRPITLRLWTLTEIQAHFPDLLTHSNHVTTSIHSTKKHLTKVWGGGMAPWPPWLRHWCERVHTYISIL